MNYETLVNLLRVEERRIRSAATHGDWKAMREAIARKQRWEDAYAKEQQQ
jgi:hypothetical protein